MKSTLTVCFLYAVLFGVFAAEAQPVITQQPLNRLVSLGGNAVFSVSASGTAPIRYQWYFNNSHWITAEAYAQMLNGFVYGVVLTNGGLGYTVSPAVQFTGGGGSGALAYASISNGIVSSINVSNTGSGYTSVPAVQIDPPNGVMPGQIYATTLNLYGSTNYSGNYWCVVSNASGSVTSSVVWLKLAATIINSPSNQIVWAGQSASFGVTVDAAGPYTYQWLFNGTNISGAVGSSLTIPVVSTNDAGNYTVLVTNQNSGVLSAPATLTVDWISRQPTNQLTTNGGNASFNVTANGSGIFSYQWFFNGAGIPANDIIITTAGNGNLGYSGDGGVATNASLNGSLGVAVDNSGNFFIADSGNSRIRKVGTKGIITTVAGNGTNGYSGDGGVATNACLTDPYGVAVDSAGNFFIADTWNNRIRKVGTNGIISTVAGNGTGGYSGDGGAATSAELFLPSCVAVDSTGNLYIADYQNCSIRKVGTNGKISTVAGNGINGYSGDGGAAVNASFNYPSGVTVDSSGNLFIVDEKNFRIRKVGTDGIITTVAGNGSESYSGDGGAATNASLYFPFGVTVDSLGNLYIADTANSRIRKVGTNGIITTVAGGGSGSLGNGGAATNASLYYPYGITMDSAGNLYIADTGNQRICKVIFGGALGLNPVATNNIGTYQVVITDVISGNSITSSVASLFMAPFVTTQPQSQSVWADAGATFTVAAGGSPPFSYQWQLSGTNIAGETNASYGLNNISTNSVGNYSVMVSSPYGTNNSLAAALAVNYISQPPTDQLMTNGGTANFSVGIAGPGPFTYQWLFNGTNLNGRTQASLAVNNVTTASVGNYSTVISLTNNLSITSSVAALNLAYPPGISQPPQSVNVAQGNNATFNVNASGTPLNYQWFMVSGTQSNATAMPVVINGFVLGANMTSGGAGYLAVPNVQIVGSSGSGAGGYAAVSNYMVSAITITNAGSGYTTPPTIQIGVPSAIMLSGQTNATLTLLTVTNGNAANYFVVVTNNFGSVTSAVAALTVFLSPQGFFANAAGGNQLALQFVGTPNYPYILQAATNLTPPVNWQPVLTNPADGNGNWQFTDTNLNVAQKFYRIVGQ